MAGFCALVLVYGAMAIALGAAVSRLLRLRCGVAEWGLLGLLATMGVALIAQLAIPIDHRLRIALVAAASLSAWWQRRAILSQRWQWVTAAICGLLLSMQPGTDGVPWDTGLYYLQTVRWLEACPIAPGLALLSPWLGLNSGIFSLAAMLHVPEWGWMSAYTLSTLVTALVVAAFIERVNASQARHSWPRMMYAVVAIGLCLPPLFYRYTFIHPDGIVRCLLLYAGLRMWEAWEDHDCDAAGIVVLLAAFALLVKLSAAIAVVMMVSLLLLRRLRTGRPLVLASVLLVVWIARSVVLSGTLIYPVPATTIGALPWADRQVVEFKANVIRAWGRDRRQFHTMTRSLSPEPAATVIDSDWVRHWWPLWGGTSTVIVTLAMLGAALAAGLATRMRHVYRAGPLAAVFAPAIAGWWIASPDPRFGEGALLGLATVCLAVTTGDLLQPVWQRWRWWWGLVLVLIAVVAQTGIRGQVTASFPETVQTPRFQLVTLTDGTEVRQTESHPDQDRCWDLPLPCAPSAVDQARLERASRYCLRGLSHR